jgi:hypothetical protein
MLMDPDVRRIERARLIVYLEAVSPCSERHSRRGSSEPADLGLASREAHW